DRGPYRSFKPEPIREQYERGKLELELFGHKLGGRWTLVRMSRSEKEWLLLKKVDGAASDSDVIARLPRSVISGLTVEEMRDAPGWLAAVRARLAELAAPRGDLAAAEVKHMLATPAAALLSRPRDVAAAMARVPVRAVFFDCLMLEGHDLRRLPLLERKEMLARVLPPSGVVQAGDHVAEHGEAFFEAASEMGLEGIIAKR